MASKHLRQLLSEDQEPFVLKNYIYERRCQLRKPVPEPHLQLKRRKPVSEDSMFLRNFCKNACLFSYHHDSPGVIKSPLFDFSSPAKSPCRNSNTLVFHIPSRTAALLLEAALRIQKQSTAKKSKTLKKFGVGFFGSILKRISHRKWNRKREIEGDEIKVSVKDILRRDSSDGRNMVAEEGREHKKTTLGPEEKRISDVGLSCSCNSRLSSTWSESNEEKSLDLETWTSRSEDSEETVFVVEEIRNEDFNKSEKNFCSSPFRFVLHNSSSPCRWLSGIESSETSPNRHKKQELKNEERHSCEAKEYGEDEKEQCSPMSILDSDQFEDDNEETEEDGQDDNDDGFELDRSFTIVQKAKQKLLHKLCRFERLADLDPTELEKRINGQEDEEFEEEEYDDDSVLSENEQSDVFNSEILRKLNMYNFQNVPSDMKRLIVDLMMEEEAEWNDRETTKIKVWKRLESWKEVELNTIDMMVELQLRREGREWWKNCEHVEEAGVEIEVAIFSFLLEELSNELAHSSGM